MIRTTVIAIAALAAASMVMVSGDAFAAAKKGGAKAAAPKVKVTVVAGTIKSIDSAWHTVRLDNGYYYTVSAADLKDYKVGQKVKFKITPKAAKA